jgi:hypothetical protein
VLVAQRAHVLQLRLLQRQDRLLVTGHCVPRLLDLDLELLDLGGFLSYLLLVVRLQVCQLYTL